MSRYFDIKLLIVSIISAIINSFTIVNFSIPAKLYPSGFTGISRLTSDIIRDFFSINFSYSIIYFVLNVIASIVVFKKIGKKFAIYSIIQFSLVSIFTMFFTPIFEVREVLLMAIFGGIINGVSVGIALAYNFSTGGFDFISVYFANKYKMDVWNYIFCFNVLLLIIAGIIYGWDISLYSIIFQFASTVIVKSMHQRYTHKTLFIITKKPDDVSQNILKNIRHGITEINATGFYSKNNTTMLYTVVNSFQYKDVVRAVLDVDPQAFINVQETVATYGNFYQKPLD